VCTCVHATTAQLSFLFVQHNDVASRVQDTYQIPFIISTSFVNIQLFDKKQLAGCIICEQYQHTIMSYSKNIRCSFIHCSIVNIYIVRTVVKEQYYNKYILLMSSINRISYIIDYV